MIANSWPGSSYEYCDIGRRLPESSFVVENCVSKRIKVSELSSMIGEAAFCVPNPALA
jgi:hypothetical protein